MNKLPAPIPVELALPTLPVVVPPEFAVFGVLEPEVKKSPEVSEELAINLGGLGVGKETEVRISDEHSDTESTARTSQPESIMEEQLFDYTELPDGQYLLNVGYNSVITDINPKYFTFGENKKVKTIFLPADAFDQLPVGDYGLGNVRGISSFVDQKVLKLSGENGDRTLRIYFKNSTPTKVIPGLEEAIRGNRDSGKPSARADNGLSNVSGLGTFIDTQDKWYVDIAKSLGFEVENSEFGKELVVGIPTPQTLSRKLDSIGLKHKLIAKCNDKGYIPVEEYVQAFAEGAYPIGTGNLDEYKHDIQDDHLSGVLGAGGQKLLDIIQPIAQTAIETGDAEKIEKTGEAIDGLTFELRTTFVNAGMGVDTMGPDSRIEQSVKDLMEILGVDYTENSFTVSILENIRDVGQSSGWSEQITNVISSRIAKLKQPDLSKS